MYISACTQDINEIPTAITMFSGSKYQIRIVVMLYGQGEETGSGKSKMVAIKLEVLKSQLVDKIGKRIQRLNLCFRGPSIQRN